MVTDTAHLERLYFDASHWNRLCDHPKREEVIRSFDRSRRAVFPSIINVAELLNTRRDERRTELCGVMTSLQDPNHTVLGHPDSEG